MRLKFRFMVKSITIFNSVLFIYLHFQYVHRCIEWLRRVLCAMCMFKFQFGSCFSIIKINSLDKIIAIAFGLMSEFCAHVVQFHCIIVVPHGILLYNIYICKRVMWMSIVFSRLSLCHTFYQCVL